MTDYTKEQRGYFALRDLKIGAHAREHWGLRQCLHGRWSEHGGCDEECSP